MAGVLSWQALALHAGWTGVPIAKMRAIQMGGLTANISSQSDVVAWNRERLSCDNANYHHKSNNNNKEPG